ncbi:DUF4438 domain-containing protein [Actinokineospora sp. NBRC 105648]|uniref:DUF4438 family protein n=1 Tax=Actinokineospora sp. NBRC 105648 TaxID=3032206 RepID=UPI0024A4FFCD|nr:DUF4438 domain-containing protein [Actinokineospora sp. NBRC 105648]GLZ40866.1 DUF4438 domain-containing protein [Actinokineospora sp. NBRC 105648]
MRTNADRLLTQVLVGEVWPPLADRHAYRVDGDGHAFLLPGMGGVTLGAGVGAPATGQLADHLEPGLSVRHRDAEANNALQFLSCVGNRVTVLGGPAAGATGRVIGQHAYVLVDLPQADLAQVAPGDRVSVHARGQGLRFLDHPAVTVKNLDPDLVAGLPISSGPDGRLRVRVAARVPATAVGAGTGMVSEFANTDLMELGPLRIGDLVALLDQDHRHGRGHRAGYVAIGAITTGDCRMFGHGPGPSTLLTGPADAFDLVDDPNGALP